MNYGFAKCSLYIDKNQEELPLVKIKKGKKEWVTCQYQEEFRYLSTKGGDFSAIRKEIRMNEKIEAPLKKGEEIGKAVYYLQNQEIGMISIVAGEEMKKAGFADYLKKVWDSYRKI